MLGIAVGERSMLVAEVHASGGGAQLVKTAEFRYPEGQTLKDSQLLGQALGQFLKSEGFGSRTAIIGLPAKWVLSRAKEVPSIEDSLMSDTLRLTTSNEFSSELGELVYDYAGSAVKGTTTTSVLLVAVPKKYIDQISQVAEAARVRVVAITPFSTSIGASAKPAQDALQLVVGPSGLEFTARQGGHPSALKYVGASIDASPLLLGELRRASTQPAGSASGREMIVWNDMGADESSLQSIGQSLDLKLRDGQVRDLGVTVADGALNGRDFATPISLALAGVAPPDRLIDFLDSRLKPPPEKKIDRRTVLAIAAAVILVAGVIYWYVSLQKNQAAADARVSALNDNKKWRDDATKHANEIEVARKWHADKPRFVSCWNDLTDAGAGSSDLYATVLTIREDPKSDIVQGTLIGKANNLKVIDALPDKLKGKKKFTSTHIVSRAVATVQGRTEYTYQIDFTYQP